MSTRSIPCRIFKAFSLRPDYTVSELAAAINVEYTVALRWMNQLNDAGVVEQRGWRTLEHPQQGQRPSAVWHFILEFPWIVYKVGQ